MVFFLLLFLLLLGCFFCLFVLFLCLFFRLACLSTLFTCFFTLEMEIRLFSPSQHWFQVFLVLRSNTAWLCLNCKVVKTKLKTVLVKIINLKPHSYRSKYISLALHQKSSLKQVLSRVSQVIRVVPLTLQRDLGLMKPAVLMGQAKQSQE